MKTLNRPLITLHCAVIASFLVVLALFTAGSRGRNSRRTHLVGYPL